MSLKNDINGKILEIHHHIYGTQLIEKHKEPSVQSIGTSIHAYLPPIPLSP